MAARLVIGMVLAGLLAGSAHAQPPEGLPPGARKITAALFISPAGEPFRFGGDMSFGLEKWFTGADADHDGALTLAEFEADHLRFFKLLDSRADGSIDGFDTTRYEQTVVPEIGDPGVPAILPAPKGGQPLIRRGKPPVPRTGAARFSLLNEVQPIRTADVDFDYRITEAEWTEKGAQRFRALDANRDGKLAMTELHLPPSQWISHQSSRPAQSLRDYYYIPYIYNPYF